jgi:glycosyltransferase involved in cell wall biosynthesis
MIEPLLTLVMPYYNEKDYLGATLASLAQQTDRRFVLRLIDNASDDGSAQVARAAMDGLQDIHVEFLTETEPGKINALRTGCEGVVTQFIGTLDADTIYPPAYVSNIIKEFSIDPTCVAVIALHDEGIGDHPRASLSKWIQTRVWRRHCHGGGCGQVFRLDAFERSGGFDADRWPYVLEDHEIIYRVGLFGNLAYHRNHVFRTSDRRSSRSSCSWNLSERLMYKLVPNAMMDWFWYRFLGPRLSQREAYGVSLRDRPWEDMRL